MCDAGNKQKLGATCLLLNKCLYRLRYKGKFVIVSTTCTTTLGECRYYSWKYSILVKIKGINLFTKWHISFPCQCMTIKEF